MDAPDPIFPARNYFYLGGYQAAVNEASGLAGLTEEQSVERDYFIHRSNIELGEAQSVASELAWVAEAGSDAPPSLLAVYRLALYVAEPSEDAAEEASEAASSEEVTQSTPALAAYAALLARAGRHGEVVELAHTHAEDGGAGGLELLAAGAASLLALRRVEAAAALAAVMARVDDDDALTHLAGAWVGLEQGGSRVMDAFHAFQELGDRYLWTAKLHAGLATAHARAGRWEEAAEELQLALRKDPRDPDVLANQAVVALHAGDDSGSLKAAEQLRALYPAHPYVTRLDQASAELDAILSAQVA